MVILVSDFMRMPWATSISRLRAHPRVRVAALTFYYLAILVGLVVLYGRGDFSTPSFVYQGF